MTDWHHAPPHKFDCEGTYMVTASTFKKQKIFSTNYLLDLLQETLFVLCSKFHWQIHACTIFSNHYQFIAKSSDNPESLRKLIQQLHSITAIEANNKQNRLGRKVWFQYWDTYLSYQKSYLARMNYVNIIPVKHRIVKFANEYPWCSASWFEQNATKSLQKTISTFKIDKVNIIDEF